MIFIEKDRRVREFLLLLFLVLVFLFLPFKFLRVAVVAVVLLRVFSALYNSLAPRFIRVQREGRTVYANCSQDFEVSLLLRNVSPVPLYMMTVKDSQSSGIFAENSAEFKVSLRPFETKKLVYSAVGRSRGAYSAGPVMINGQDPFGTYSFKRKIASDLRIIVYPTVRELDLPQKTGLPSGNIKVGNKLYEDLTRYSAIREYQPGDEMKRINWKASARMGKLFSMEYQPSIYFPVLVVVNLSERDFPLRGKESQVNRITEVAASLVFYAVRIKQAIGMVTTGIIPGEEQRPSAPVKAGYGNAVNILEILARVQLDPDYVNFASFMVKAGVKIPNGSKIFVVSPPLKEEEAVQLMSQRRKGRHIELFEVTTRFTEKKDEVSHDIKTHAVKEHGEELVHG
jgi:uncharacterized protein (DUF58 family)